MPSDSDEDAAGEFDDENENDQDIDEEITDAFQNLQDVDDVATEDGEEDSGSEDDEDEDDEDEDGDDEDDASSPAVPGDHADVDMDVDQPTQPATLNESLQPFQAESTLPAPPYQATASQPPAYQEGSPIQVDKEPTPPLGRTRSHSPAYLRRKAISFPYGADYVPRTLTIEAICALPHPAPTHALASSHCMTHLLTGSDDGYIRDYDIFPAVNGKSFLSAPQRHHTGVVEGLLKSAQVRYWWENPAMPTKDTPAKEGSLSSVYSLAMHSDALWALAGSDTGHINLFTVRHSPGRVAHVFSEHKSEVSSLCLDYDEASFFSAGWDGRAIQWDLHTGQAMRSFTSHGAQLSSISVRPENAINIPVNAPPKAESMEDKKDMDDSKSDASYDPLFDDEPPPQASNALMQGKAPPSNAPPLLNTALYSMFSPNMLMTTAADGQVMLWDKRETNRVGRLWMHEKTPPLCLSACWSADGQYIYAARRNSTIDVWDIRYCGERTVNILRNPVSSGVVSAVVALPDNKHIACASQDNIRLWDVSADHELDASMKAATSKSALQFKIIPGHHGGTVSQLLVDPAGRFMISASSSRGWVGESTRTVFVHDIKHGR